MSPAWPLVGGICWAFTAAILAQDAQIPFVRITLTILAGFTIICYGVALYAQTH